MTDAPPTSPARPTLEPQPGKPDIVEWIDSKDGQPGLEAAMVEARRVLAKPVAAIGEQLP